MSILSKGARFFGRTLPFAWITLVASACSQAKSPVMGAAETERPDSRLSQGDHTAMIGGMPIVYHVYGKGPVVFAHPGGPGGGWGYLRMREVEQFATVVYIEPIGTGASGRLSNPAEYSRLLDAANVDGLRAHVGIEKVMLLGHSYGGFVALTYALTYPDHVGALILFDTSPTTGPDFQKDVASNMEWFKNEPWFGDASAALDEVDHVQTDEAMTKTFTRAVPLYIANWSQRRQELEGKLPAFQLYVERNHRQKANMPQDQPVPKGPAYDVRPRLGEIKVPTLIEVGEKDFICSAKMADIMHRGIPGSRLVVLPNTGHLAHVETPREHARVIREFLGQVAR
ncbi:alpha/beta hydrolase [Pendulispora brunnea]|uniref:Alpha/beta hydrolase n=1 Tax=Pendulispora brunnea TaxID=2905690 RepID=A0ABZ2KMS5_9BACT